MLLGWLLRAKRAVTFTHENLQSRTRRAVFARSALHAKLRRQPLQLVSQLDQLATGRR